MLYAPNGAPVLETFKFARVFVLCSSDEIKTVVASLERDAATELRDELSAWLEAMS